MEEKEVTYKQMHGQLMQLIAAGHQMVDALLMTGGVPGDEEGKIKFHPFLTVLQYEAHRSLEEVAYRVSDMYTEIHARTEEGLAETAERAAEKGNAPFSVVEGGKTDA